MQKLSPRLRHTVSLSTLRNDTPASSTFQTIIFLECFRNQDGFCLHYLEVDKDNLRSGNTLHHLLKRKRLHSFHLRGWIEFGEDFVKKNVLCLLAIFKNHTIIEDYSTNLLNLLQNSMKTKRRDLSQ